LNDQGNGKLKESSRNGGFWLARFRSTGSRHLGFERRLSSGSRPQGFSSEGNSCKDSDFEQYMHDSLYFNGYHNCYMEVVDRPSSGS